MIGLDFGVWFVFWDNCLDVGGCFEGGVEKYIIINLK